MSRFPQELYEIAANEVAQRNVVHGIMAKASTDAGGDEKKAIACYIEYRAAQLAQEASEKLHQKRRGERAAAKRPAILRFREPAYAVLSALFGIVTLILVLLTVFLVFAAIRGALNQAIPHDAARFNAILICFVVAIVCGFLAALCGRLTSKCMRAANRK